jgi:hypothetical protein
MASGVAADPLVRGIGDGSDNPQELRLSMLRDIKVPKANSGTQARDPERSR